MFFPIILKVPTTVCLRWCIYIGYSCASQEKEQEDCAAFFFLEMTKTTSKQTFFMYRTAYTAASYGVVQDRQVHAELAPTAPASVQSMTLRDFCDS